MTAFLKEYPTIILLVEVLYFIAIVLLATKIIIDTKNVSKTLAYLLLIIFLPIMGVIIYFLFGVNYRKNKFYKFKIKRDEKLYQKIQSQMNQAHKRVMDSLAPEIIHSQNTINFLYKGSHSPITQGNHIELLINGEEKFPKVLEVLAKAKHHIHLEYYIFDNDKIGNQIADLLIKKAKEGVIIRFLYDGFGSRKIGKSLLNRLQAHGIQTAPVNRIKFKLFANRVNYRDHRKIIIVDGEHVFTGGINIADRYINPNPDQYWRDTHLYLHGNAAFYFQYLFFTNWIFAVEQYIKDFKSYFITPNKDFGNKIAQAAVSGPDIRPSIMLSTASAIYEAKRRIYITTPYFIPVESVFNALKIQALAGIDIRLIVPEKGDSLIVNAAAYSYYDDLLKAGVRIFLFKNGFIHAKTMLIDNNFSSVGSANMDVRSQELNFEVNTHIYDQEINSKLHDSFRSDLKECQEISLEEWQERSKVKEFGEHLARLFSPLL